jgi:hypothetical protein
MIRHSTGRRRAEFVQEPVVGVAIELRRSTFQVRRPTTIPDRAVGGTAPARLLA